MMVTPINQRLRIHLSPFWFHKKKYSNRFEYKTVLGTIAMKKYIPVVLLILIIVIGLFYFSYQRSNNSSVPTKDSSSPQILTNKEGSPAMASGNCNQNSDCFPSGCSSQVCANHEVVTTCEVVEIPEKETYSCGCIQNRCVWYRDRSN